MIKKAFAYYLLGIFSLLLTLNSMAVRPVAKAEVKAAIASQSEEKSEVISSDLFPSEGITLQSSKQQVCASSRTIDQKKSFPVYARAQLYQLQQYGIFSLQHTCVVRAACLPPLYLTNRVLLV